MSVLFAILIGIIQGVTEFLPISSSGHLCIMQNMFGMEDVETNYFTFDILLHLATLIAVFIVFRRDIANMIVAFFTLIKKAATRRLREITPDERMLVMVALATVPLVVAVFVKDYVEILYGYTKAIGAILIFNGLVLFLSDFLARGNKDANNASYFDALVVGLCQLCALLPGLSRSGSTITGGLLCGFKREYAVKFSFIMSIPAIVGANILSIPDMLENPVPQSDIFAYICGMAAALVTGIAAMKLLMYISKKSNFSIFSVYCVIVGTLALIFG
jgi:undecaprenyl-diphosphatase